jgi:hypothetical protein
MWAHGRGQERRLEELLQAVPECKRASNTTLQGQADNRIRAYGLYAKHIAHDRSPHYSLAGERVRLRSVRVPRKHRAGALLMAGRSIVSLEASRFSFSTAIRLQFKDKFLTCIVGHGHNSAW